MYCIYKCISIITSKVFNSYTSLIIIRHFIHYNSGHNCQFFMMVKNGFLNISESDECSSNPCKYSGTCVDKFADYQCTCSNGFTGRNCETGEDFIVHNILVTFEYGHVFIVRDEGARLIFCATENSGLANFACPLRMANAWRRSTPNVLCHRKFLIKYMRTYPLILLLNINFGELLHAPFIKSTRI